MTKYLWYSYMSDALTLPGACFSMCSTSAYSVLASLRSALYPSLGQLRSSLSVRFCESLLRPYLTVASFIASCHFVSFLPYAPSAFTPAMANRLYWLSGRSLICASSFPVIHLAWVGASSNPASFARAFTFCAYVLIELTVHCGPFS